MALFYTALLSFLVFMSFINSEHFGSPFMLSKLQSLKSFFHEFRSCVLDFPSYTSQFQVAGSQSTYNKRTFFSLLILDYASKLQIQITLFPIT